MQGNLNYSDDFRSNIRNLECSDPQMVLVEISHPMLGAEVLRFVSDNKDFEFQGELWIALDFDVTRIVDDKNEYPYGSLDLCNVTGVVTPWVMKYGDQKNARIKFIFTLRKTGIIEREICGYVSKFLDDTGDNILSAEWSPFPFRDEDAVKTNIDAYYSPGLKNS